MGLRILVNLSGLKTAVPLDVIVTRPSFLEKNRGIVKRVLRAFIEAIHVLKSNKAKAAAVYQKMLGEDEPIVAAGLYEYFARQFSSPPRVNREGLRLTANLIAGQSGAAMARPTSSA